MLFKLFTTGRLQNGDISATGSVAAEHPEPTIAIRVGGVSMK